MLWPLAGMSNQVRSSNVDDVRLLNLYAEVTESRRGKVLLTAYGTPGLTLFGALGGLGGIRGLYTSTDRRCFAVQGAGVYEVYASGASHMLGTLGTSTGPVSMADNGLTLVVVDGSTTGYTLALASTTWGTLTDPDFLGADRVAFVDGYFAFNRPGTGQWYVSDLYSTSIDALDFATAEGRADRIVSLMADHREVWLFGDTTTEVWFNAGLADFPFARIQGAFLDVGCVGAHAAARMHDAVYWLGADDRGRASVWTARGYVPERVSTHAVERAIQGYSTVADAIAFTTQHDGHYVLWLTFPTANATWCFDRTTGLWHERAFRDPVTGTLGRHRAAAYTVAFGTTLCGDWENGNLYTLDLATYTDNGHPIRRELIFPHLFGDRLQMVRHRTFELDCERGVGLDAAAVPGTDPVVTLRWSDDGGHVWSEEHTASLGKIGAYTHRARWTRLGRSRDRLYAVATSEPVKIAWLAANIAVEVP